jgi:hypothetical protein
MKKLSHLKAHRKSSTVGAEGTDRPTAPGSEQRSPLGSNGRSYLTLHPDPVDFFSSGSWNVVRIDDEGDLHLVVETVLVR